MRSVVTITAVLLLLVNGIGAFYGGWNLMMYRDGSSFLRPLSYLEHSPFADYFIPGLILFIVNGAFIIIIFVMVILKLKFSCRAVIVEGVLLFDWITVQVLHIRSVDILHYVFWTIAVLLINTGWLMMKYIRPSSSD